jgi:hypothetical protein
MSDEDRDRDREYARQAIISLGGAKYLARDAAERLDAEDNDRPDDAVLNDIAGTLQRAANLARDAALHLRLSMRTPDPSKETDTP